MKRWMVLAVMAVGAAVASAAEPPVQQGSLIGKWLNTTSDWPGECNLELRADRTALLQIKQPVQKEADAPPSSPRKGDGNGAANGSNRKQTVTSTTETRLGTFGVRRGVWGLTLRDLNDRQQYFSIVSIDADRLHLIDATGKKRAFARTK